MKIMSPSGLTNALASLEPANFYSGTPMKKKNWDPVMKKNSTKNGTG
jgi:hypothetical protein